MKLIKILCFVTLIHPCYAQICWEQCNSPLDCSFVVINTIMYADKILYVGCTDGLYRSTDDGASFHIWGFDKWNYLEENWVSALGIDSLKYLYAGTRYPDHLYRRLSPQSEWEQLSLEGHISAIRYHPDGWLFVTTSLGIFRSSDHGIVWQNVSAGLPGINTGPILVTDAGDIFIGVEGWGVFKSSNLGQTWANKSLGILDSSPRNLYEDRNGYLLAALGGDGNGPRGIHISSNGGSTWMSTPLFTNAHFTFRAADGIMYAATDNAFAMCPDYSYNWQYLNTLGSPQCITGNSSGHIFVGQLGGVWKSEDKGLTFQCIGLPSIKFFSFSAPIDGYIYAGASGIWSPTVYRSSDNGINWTGYNSGLSGWAFSLLRTNSGALIAGLLNKGIYKLNANGTWVQVMNEPVTIQDIKQSINGDLYAVSPGIIVYKSTNDGQNWELMSNSMLFDSTQTVAVSNNVVLVGTTGGGLYSFTPSGGFWVQRNQGLGNYDIAYLVKKSEDSVFASTSNGVYLYLTSSENWIDINEPISQRAFGHLLIVNNFLFAAAREGIYCYNINTGTWSEISEGLFSSAVYSLGFTNGYLTAGTSSGVFKTVTSILPPDKPLNLYAERTGPSQVELSWIDSSENESGFIIEREMEGTEVFNVIDTVGENITSYTDNNLLTATYRYRIKAYNFFGESEYSNIANVYVPVELTSFTAVQNSVGEVIIKWVTSSELNNYGFAIERKSDGDYKTIAFVKGEGTSTEIKYYTYKDNFGGVVCRYRLRQIDLDGTFKYSPEIQFNSEPVFALFQNYPNPFNSETIIKYSIPYSTSVNIIIYSAIGEKIMTLLNEVKEPGIYSLKVNAEQLAAGIYYYKIQTPEYSKALKLMVMK